MLWAVVSDSGVRTSIASASCMSPVLKGLLYASSRDFMEAREVVSIGDYFFSLLTRESCRLGAKFAMEGTRRL